MNAIAHRTAGPVSLRPSVQTRAMSDMIGRFMNRLEDTDVDGRKCLSAGIAPSENERSALERRRAELLASLEPDADRARKVIGALLGSFPSYGEDEETARFVLAACCRACAKVPAWAIEEASGRFIENTVRIQWDMSKRPTPPQIVAEAMRCVLPVEAELHRLEQVLNAEIVDSDTTEDERREAVARWEQIKAEMGRSNVITERTGDEIAKERAEQIRANEAVERRDALARERAGMPPAPSPFAPREVLA